MVRQGAGRTHEPLPAACWQVGRTWLTSALPLCSAATGCGVSAKFLVLSLSVLVSKMGAVITAANDRLLWVKYHDPCKAPITPLGRSKSYVDALQDADRPCGGSSHAPAGRTRGQKHEPDWKGTASQADRQLAEAFATCTLPHRPVLLLRLRPSDGRFRKSGGRKQLVGVTQEGSMWAGDPGPRLAVGRGWVLSLNTVSAFSRAPDPSLRGGGRAPR